MFTKEDYEDYFEQLARIERKMTYGVYDLGREIHDPSIARVLRKVGDDEVRHYGYILKMLRAVADPGEFENWTDPWKHHLGVVRLKSFQGQSAEEVKAYVVNLTPAGICLECSEDLLIDSAWDLEIRLVDSDEVISRRGKVVWSKEVEPDFHISGIAFEPQ
jgi:hypothetical protein